MELSLPPRAAGPPLTSDFLFPESRPWLSGSGLAAMGTAGSGGSRGSRGSRGSFSSCPSAAGVWRCPGAPLPRGTGAGCCPWGWGALAVPGSEPLPRAASFVSILLTEPFPSPSSLFPSRGPFFHHPWPCPGGPRLLPVPIRAPEPLLPRSPSGFPPSASCPTAEFVSPLALRFVLPPRCFTLHP